MLRPQSALSTLSVDLSTTAHSHEADTSTDGHDTSPQTRTQDTRKTNKQMIKHHTNAHTLALPPSDIHRIRAQTDVFAPIPKAPGSEAGWGDDHCTPLSCSPLSSPELSFVGRDSRVYSQDTDARSLNLNPNAGLLGAVGAKNVRENGKAVNSITESGRMHDNISNVRVDVVSERLRGGHGDRDVSSHVLSLSEGNRRGHTAVNNSSHVLSVESSVISTNRMFVAECGKSDASKRSDVSDRYVCARVFVLCGCIYIYIYIYIYTCMYVCV
jgi:hypothetical protein